MTGTNFFFVGTLPSLSQAVESIKYLSVRPRGVCFIWRRARGARGCARLRPPALGEPGWHQGSCGVLRGRGRHHYGACGTLGCHGCLWVSWPPSPVMVALPRPWWWPSCVWAEPTVGGAMWRGCGHGVGGVIGRGWGLRQRPRPHHHHGYLLAWAMSPGCQCPLLHPQGVPRVSPGVPRVSPGSHGPLFQPWGVPRVSLSPPPSPGCQCPLLHPKASPGNHGPLLHPQGIPRLSPRCPQGVSVPSFTPRCPLNVPRGPLLHPWEGAFISCSP